MTLIDIPLGLVIYFHCLKLADGISSLILHGAKQEQLLVGVDGENRAFPLCSLR